MNKSIFLAVMMITSAAFSQVNPFGEISGSYKVVLCRDTSVTPRASGNLCDSKSVFIGILPGDNVIGVRFVDVDYVTFSAVCSSPVICKEHQIYSERLVAELPGQVLITDIGITPINNKSLRVHFHRHLTLNPDGGGKTFDATVDLTLEKRR